MVACTAASAVTAHHDGSDGTGGGLRVRACARREKSTGEAGRQPCSGAPKVGQWESSERISMGEAAASCAGAERGPKARVEAHG